MNTIADFLAFAGRLTNYELRVPPPLANAGQGHRFTLEAMHALVASLPELATSPRIRVLVAGTHGKGSVTHWLAGLFAACGLGVGSYYSPHVLGLVERIHLGCRPIDEATFMAAARRVAPAFVALESRGLVPTFFDLITAIGALVHAQAGVQASVLEIGLGGRLDSTNVFTPTVSVITEIDYDHMDVLGSTLTAIAGEKAGILRPGTPFVTQQSQPEAEAALIECAQAIGARPIEVRTATAELLGYDIPSPGRHQRRNLGLAVRAAELALGRTLDRATIARGLELAGAIPARCQSVRAQTSGTRWIIDGGHTPGAARALAEYLRELDLTEALSSPGAVAVLGLARDKDPGRFLAGLAPALAACVVTPYASPRATPPAELAEHVRRAGVARVACADSPAQALALADRIAATLPGARRVVAGSFYLAGEVLRDDLLAPL